MNWVKSELITGIQKLLCLNLDRSPARDMLKGTASAWFEAITDGNAWDQERDAPRFRAAFRTLAKTRETWPAPKHFLEALPSIVAEREPRRLESDAAREKGMRHIRDIMEKLGMPGEQAAPDAEH